MSDTELANYKLQLQQVEAALLGDAENEELLKLKVDLEEIISLQEELAAADQDGDSGADAPGGSEPKEFKVGDRVYAPLPTGHRAVAQIESLSAAGAAIKFVTSGQKTIVDPSDLVEVPGGGAKNYAFQSKSNEKIGNKKEWAAERERRKMRAQKKELKRKEIEVAKESEKNSWQKFNTKASNKGMKGLKRLSATGSSQDSRIASQTVVSSRSNNFAFKSARGNMDSLF